MEEPIGIEVSKNEQTNWMIKPTETTLLSQEEQDKRMRECLADPVRAAGLNSPFYSSLDFPMTLTKSYVNHTKDAQIKSVIICEERGEESGKLKARTLKLELGNKIVANNPLFKALVATKHNLSENIISFDIGKRNRMYELLGQFNFLASFSEDMQKDIATFLSPKNKDGTDDDKNIKDLRDKMFNTSWNDLLQQAEQTSLQPNLF
jgi:hypothetical protein